MESVQALRSLTLSDRYFNKSVKTHVWEFSLILAVIIIGYGSFKSYKTADLAILFSCTFVGFVLAGIGKFIPSVLIYPWRSWMIFGTLLGSVVSVVILTILWFIMLTPISAILRIFGISVMDMKFRTGEPSYWKTKDSKKDNFKLLEKQF